MGSKPLISFLFIALLFFASHSTPADADQSDYTTTAMYLAIKDNSLTWGIFWTGYIAGIAETSAHVCLPQGITHSQANQIVFNYLRDHPKIWNLPPSRTVPLALSDAFPCENK